MNGIRTFFSIILRRKGSEENEQVINLPRDNYDVDLFYGGRKYRLEQASDGSPKLTEQPARTK